MSDDPFMKAVHALRLRVKERENKLDWQVQMKPIAWGLRFATLFALFRFDWLARRMPVVNATVGESIIKWTQKDLEFLLPFTADCIYCGLSWQQSQPWSLDGPPLCRCGRSATLSIGSPKGLDPN